MNHLLHPEADAEFLDALGHYAEISRELGDRFYDEVSGLLRAVCIHPLRYRVIDPPERRLFFVGLTRAQEQLFLTHARRRHWRGELRDRYPSPFLHDIHESLFVRECDDPEARRRTRQLELF